MDFLNGANIDLDTFSPNTQRALVTLEGPSVSDYNFGIVMNGLNSESEDFNVSNLSTQLVALSSTPNRKNRKPTNPRKLDLICNVCEVRKNDTVIKCNLCLKNCHTSCSLDAMCEFICCLTCKKLPSIVRELRSQRDRLNVFRCNV